MPLIVCKQNWKSFRPCIIITVFWKLTLSRRRDRTCDYQQQKHILAHVLLDYRWISDVARDTPRNWLVVTAGVIRFWSCAWTNPNERCSVWDDFNFISPTRLVPERAMNLFRRYREVSILACSSSDETYHQLMDSACSLNLVSVTLASLWFCVC